MRQWLVLALGVAAFLVAAKAHGRQLRLERELAGYWEVTFRAQNPAWVEALWRRERFVYWGLAAALALLAIAFRLLASRLDWPLPLTRSSGEGSFIGGLLLHLAFPMIVAFIVTGLLSLTRLASAVRDASGAGADRPPDWLAGAAWGSAGWWILSIALVAALFVFAWKRPT